MPNQILLDSGEKVPEMTTVEITGMVDKLSIGDSNGEEYDTSSEDGRSEASERVKSEDSSTVSDGSWTKKDWDRDREQGRRSRSSSESSDSSPSGADSDSDCDEDNEGRKLEGKDVVKYNDKLLGILDRIKNLKTNDSQKSENISERENNSNCGEHAASDLENETSPEENQESSEDTESDASDTEYTQRNPLPSNFKTNPPRADKPYDAKRNKNSKHPGRSTGHLNDTKPKVTSSDTNAGYLQRGPERQVPTIRTHNLTPYDYRNSFSEQGSSISDEEYSSNVSLAELDEICKNELLFFENVPSDNDDMIGGERQSLKGKIYTSVPVHNLGYPTALPPYSSSPYPPSNSTNSPGLSSPRSMDGGSDSWQSYTGSPVRDTISFYPENAIPEKSPGSNHSRSTVVHTDISTGIMTIHTPAINNFPLDETSWPSFSGSLSEPIAPIPTTVSDMNSRRNNNVKYDEYLRTLETRPSRYCNRFKEFVPLKNLLKSIHFFLDWGNEKFVQTFANGYTQAMIQLSEKNNLPQQFANLHVILEKMINVPQSFEKRDYTRHRYDILYMAAIHFEKYEFVTGLVLDKMYKAQGAQSEIWRRTYDDSNNTLIHILIMNGSDYLKVLQELLDIKTTGNQAVFDLSATNIYGKTPKDLAIEARNQISGDYAEYTESVLRLLREYGMRYM